MNLANICIHRPVFTVMLMAALVVLGLFSYTGLGLDLYPKIDFPVVSIAATLPGAGPEEIETQLAKPIEEAISTLGGIDIMTTSCVFGMCRIVVRFDLEKNIDVAAQEVRDRVARILKTLPEGTESPIIEKMDPDASPVITVVLSSPMPLRELTYFARKQIKEPLEAIEGVGAIQVVGGREREIHAILDAKKLAAFQTSVTQVRDALKGQNIDIPGGNITNGPNESILRTLGRIQTPEEFGDVIVQVQNGIPLRLKDLGTIIDHEEEARTTARLNGKTALALVVQKKSGTNTVQVIDTIKQRLKDLSKEFPQGLTYAIIRDQSQFIKASLHELNLHLVLGAILASAVVYLFMQNLVSTLISALAIPISLISTFLLMRLMGFTLNNMSMLGLTLAVGIVIDDAIVVLENVYRHMEEKGSDAMTAASEATSEISLAVLATSLSLAVIFVPVAFMQGIIGRFLNNFGLTIAFSILISIFVSFTLTPMMCSRLFRYRFARGSGHSKESAFYRVIDRVYGRLLRFSLDHRWVIILLCILSLVALKPMGAFIRSDFVPVDDTGEYTISFRAPEHTSLDGTRLLLDEIEAKIRTLQGVQNLYSSIGEGSLAGVNDAQIFVQLKDLKERDFSMFDSMTAARKILSEYPRLRPAVQASGGISGAKNYDTQMYIRGPDFKQINTWVADIMTRMRQNPLFANVDSSFIEGKPEVQVVFDRERAHRLGVRMEQVAAGLRTLVGGKDQITRFKEGEELYEVRVRLRPEDRVNPEAIAGLLFPTTNGTMVRLDAVASIRTGAGPAQIDRQDRQRAITVYANLAPKAGLGDANDFLLKCAKAQNMPSAYTSGFTGRGREMERTKRGFGIAFLLSAIFMYMILASQFESFLHPVTIMLSLPLSVPFAILSLLLTDSSLNVFSGLGVFMLFGIVKKNAILQIDYTNTLREKGLNRDQAVVEANHARLRPILMTTITLVIGMLPMALGTGPGAAVRATLATVIVGGQSLCLLITLLLTPVAYTLFDDVVVWLQQHMPRLER